MGCGASSQASLDDSFGRRNSLYAPTLPQNSVPAQNVPAHAHLLGRSTNGGGQSLHECVGCCTTVGHRPKSSAQGEVLNQDRGIVAWPLVGKGPEARLLLGVFDGHGPLGEAASDFVALTLLTALEEQLAGKTSSGGCQFSPVAGKLSRMAGADASEAKLLERALVDVETRLSIEHKHLAHHNGTTVLLALLRPGAVSVANIGDSRCVVGVADRTNGTWEARDLSIDHTPAVPRERARVLKLGGALTGDTNDAFGAVRVLSKSSLSSLALSRSVGDLAFADVGVTGEPELRDEQLTAQHRCLLLATDGVWAFLSSQEAVALVERHRASGARRACKELVREAAARWHAREGAYRDDITALLVFFEDGRPSAATATTTATATASANGAEANGRAAAAAAAANVGGGGNAGAAMTETETLEFLSVEELAEGLSHKELLPFEKRLLASRSPGGHQARSEQQRCKKRLLASRSPGGHRRPPALGGGHAVKWRQETRGEQTDTWRADTWRPTPSVSSTPDFRRKQLTLSDVAADDLTKLASMADELDANDW